MNKVYKLSSICDIEILFIVKREFKYFIYNLFDRFKLMRIVLIIDFLFF